MVHQHFKLSPSFTVAENVVPRRRAACVVQPRRRTGARSGTSWRSARSSASSSIRRAVVGKLPVGLRQRVEILKALYRKARILILDEPTAVLTPRETHELFATMRSLASNGCAVIFISHKLREVLAVSDAISVMRRGRVIRTFANANVTAQDIANEMVGRSVLLRVDKAPSSGSGRQILAVDGLVSFGDRGDVAVDGLSLRRPGRRDRRHRGRPGKRAGRVGRVRRRPSPARLRLRLDRCERAAPTAPLKARQAGLAYIPADRGGVGLSLKSSIWENLTVGHLADVRIGTVPVVARGEELGPRPWSRISTSAAAASTLPPVRCPAAISRRCRSPGS